MKLLDRVAKHRTMRENPKLDLLFFGQIGALGAGARPDVPRFTVDGSGTADGSQVEAVALDDLRSSHTPMVRHLRGDNPGRLTEHIGAP